MKSQKSQENRRIDEFCRETPERPTGKGAGTGLDALPGIDLTFDGVSVKQGLLLCSGCLWSILKFWFGSGSVCVFLLLFPVLGSPTCRELSSLYKLSMLKMNDIKNEQQETKGPKVCICLAGRTWTFACRLLEKQSPILKGNF